MGRLDGKVALISGAARGMGEAEAGRFAAEGAQVLVGDVLDDLARDVAAEIGDRAAAQHLDVTDPRSWSEAVDETVARFGKLDVLVNNAGILRVGMIEDMALDDYLAVMQVNQVGVWLGMKAVIPAMRAAGGGSIVNISSTGGLTGLPGLSAYVSSKFAVRGMTKCAAVEVGHDCIRVNSVHPGLIDTALGDSGMTREETDALNADQPIPRVGLPEEVAELVTYLASDASAYCTGAEFVIDGGAMASPVRLPAAVLELDA